MGRFKHLLLAIMAVAGLVLGGCGSDNNTTLVVPYNGKFMYANNDAVVNSVSGFAIKANGTLVELAGSPFLTGGAGFAGRILCRKQDSAGHVQEASVRVEPAGRYRNVFPFEFGHR